MNNKLLKQKLEFFLKEKEIPFKIKENKNKTYATFLVFPNSNFKTINPVLESESLFIHISVNYMVFHLFGWENIEKPSTFKEIEESEIFSLLKLFLEKKLKIKIGVKKNKIINWKIFAFQEESWKLLFNSKRFFFQTKKTVENFEINIDDLKTIFKENLDA